MLTKFRFLSAAIIQSGMVGHLATARITRGEGSASSEHWEGQWESTRMALCQLLYSAPFGWLDCHSQAASTPEICVKVIVH